jgi:hypothetical protein
VRRRIPWERPGHHWHHPRRRRMSMRRWLLRCLWLRLLEAGLFAPHMELDQRGERRRLPDGVALEPGCRLCRRRRWWWQWRRGWWGGAVAGRRGVQFPPSHWPISRSSLRSMASRMTSSFDKPQGVSVERSSKALSHVTL